MMKDMEKGSCDGQTAQYTKETGIMVFNMDTVGWHLLMEKLKKEFSLRMYLMEKLTRNKQENWFKISHFINLIHKQNLKFSNKNMKLHSKI